MRPPIPVELTYAPHPCCAAATRRYKQQVYDLAMERKRQLDAIHEEGYHMPDSYDAPEKRNSRCGLCDAVLVHVGAYCCGCGC